MNYKSLLRHWNVELRLLYVKLVVWIILVYLALPRHLYKF